MDKLLVLGGKPIGSTEIVERAKEKGIYTIVADYLPASESPAKLISDEQWDISVDQVDELARKATEEHVIAKRVLTLPLYADLALEDVDHICDIILSCKQ